jgi:hypothetical protein
MCLGRSSPLPSLSGPGAPTPSSASHDHRPIANSVPGCAALISPGPAGQPDGTGEVRVARAKSPLIRSWSTTEGDAMSRARRLLITLLLPMIIVLGIVATAAAGGGPSGKVEICHFASHKYVKISVSTNALPAHLRHGDVLPDQYGSCP